MSRITATTKVAPITLHEAVRMAIEEQERRVWCLRNLIECVQLATREGGEPTDLEAAHAGLLDLADAIHRALDVGAIAQRATEIDAEERRDAERSVRDVLPDAEEPSAPHNPAVN